jgi:hypothetical protein
MPVRSAIGSDNYVHACIAIKSFAWLLYGEWRLKFILRFSLDMYVALSRKYIHGYLKFKMTLSAVNSSRLI